MLGKIIFVLARLAMLVVMLGVGVHGGKYADRDSANDEENMIGIGVVTGDIARVRKGPSVTAEFVAALRGGQEVTVLSEENGFYQIVIETEDGETVVEGYMKKELIRMIVYFHKNSELK